MHYFLQYLPAMGVYVHYGHRASLRESPRRVLSKGSFILMPKWVIHSLSGAALLFALPVDMAQFDASEKLHCVNTATGAVVAVWLVVYWAAVVGRSKWLSHIFQCRVQDFMKSTFIGDKSLITGVIDNFIIICAWIVIYLINNA